MTRSAFGAVLVILLTLGSWLTAFADDSSEAQLRFRLGSELASDGNYAEAIQHFLGAYRLVPNARTVANIIFCYDRLAVQAQRTRDSAAVDENRVQAFNWCDTLERRFGDEPEVVSQLEATCQNLLPQLPVLNVETAPPGATIYLARRSLGDVGVSPRQVAVADMHLAEDGTVKVIASLEGYVDAEVDVSVERGVTTPVEIALRPRVGTLRVESNPPGARVFAEDSTDPLGVTPLEIEHPIGRVSLRLELDGYMELERATRVEEGAVASLEVTMRRAASSIAALTVRGTPHDAIVRLDGNELGDAPVSVGDISPGRAVLEVEADGYRPYRGEVVFEPGAATRVEYELRSDPGVVRTVLLAGGYGVGAATTVVAAILGGLALGERSAFYRDPDIATREQLDRTHGLAITADVLGIVGAVVLAGTIVYHLLTIPRDSTAAVGFER